MEELQTTRGYIGISITMLGVGIGSGALYQAHKDNITKQERNIHLGISSVLLIGGLYLVISEIKRNA